MNEVTKRMIRGLLQRLNSLRQAAGRSLRRPRAAAKPTGALLLENVGHAGVEPVWRELSRSIWP